MGILNVTPDSFSDGGRFLKPSQAISRALRMEKEGADLIDIGGESTRPGARPVPAKEELRRVLPVIEKLAPRLHIPISIDTSKAVVAQAALSAGACLVNDVSALRDPRMGEVVARFRAPLILMHMRGTPRTMQKNPFYRRLVPEIIAQLRGSIARARAFGIPAKKILLDPGLGFGKRSWDNLRLVKGLPAFKALGFPIVVGPSRKSFIGRVLSDREGETIPVGERLWGTAAAVVACVVYGADVVRVHDVKPMRQVVKLADALLRA